MTMMEKWVVVKECPIGSIILTVNSEIEIVHGCVYYNSCLMTPFYQNEFMKLIEKERIQNNYLKKGKYIVNKV